MKSSSFLSGLLVCVVLLSVSCNHNKELHIQNIKLKQKNDILMSILDTLKTKYIFDKALLQQIPDPESINRDGGKYNGKIFFLAYNEEDVLLFKTDKDKPADTLYLHGGAYHFETKRTGEKTCFYFNPIIKNKTALDFANLGYHGVNFRGCAEK